MGSFSKMAIPFVDFITGKRLERRLRVSHNIMFAYHGWTPSMANEKFSRFMQEIREESRRDRTDNLPRNYGDWLLKEESKNPKIHQMLDKARAGGATNQDIRNWWNKHDLERRMQLKQDDFVKTAVSLDWLEKNYPDLGKLSKEEQGKAF